MGRDSITTMLVVCCLVVGAASATGSNCDLVYYPDPNKCQANKQNIVQEGIFACKMTFTGIEDQGRYQHFYQIIDFYLKQHFKCETFSFKTNFKSLDKANKTYTLEIAIKDPSLRSVFTAEEEKYSLQLNVGKGKLTADTYVGFVRGLETFAQSFDCSHERVCSIGYLPIVIQDQPLYPHRGIMIDSGHNFIPLDIIYQTIDSMMYNKMNVLHWQICNQDAFTVVLEKHPELARFGAEDQDSVYSKQNIKDIVKYALIRGVRIIPEINIPYSSLFWERAYQGENFIAKSANYGPRLDLTLDKSYEILRDIYAQLMPLFPDPMFHLGFFQGVKEQGFKNRSKIIDADNLPENYNLNEYYRRREKKMLRQVLVNKTLIYWIKTYNETYTILDKDDIVHWFGKDNPNKQIPQKMILSKDPATRLHQGYQSDRGQNNGNFWPWRRMFQIVFPPGTQTSTKSQLIGMQGLLWSYTTNRHSHLYKLWMRGSIIAQKLWNAKIKSQFPDLARRLIQLQLFMQKRGIPVSAVTSQICENDIMICERI